MLDHAPSARRAALVDAVVASHQLGRGELTVQRSSNAFGFLARPHDSSPLSCSRALEEASSLSAIAFARFVIWLREDRF